MRNKSCGNTMIICIAGPLLLLLLPVVSGQMDLNTSLFIHYNQMLNWRDAQTFCRKFHTDLLTITNEIENKKFFISRGWIGLYRDDSASPWKWSRRDEIAKFTTWASSVSTKDENCAYKIATLQAWSTDKCDLTHTFNCYDDKLVLVTENKTWEEALNYCRALEAVNQSKPATNYRNNRYDLATLISSDDYTSAQDKMQSASTDQVWTGLRFLAGHWLWVGGETVQNNDIQRCPAQWSCGVLVKNSSTPVVTNDCKLRMNFFCYRRPLPTNALYPLG